MFARVSHARYPPEQHDAGLRVVVEDLLPALRNARLPGVLPPRRQKPGTGLAVVLWETEEAADAASADRRITAAHVKLGALGLAIEARQIYEVVAHDGPSEDRSGCPSRAPAPIASRRTNRHRDRLADPGVRMRKEQLRNPGPTIHPDLAVPTALTPEEESPCHAKHA